MSIVTSTPTFLGLGGFGHDGEVPRAHAEIFRYDPKTRSWATAPAKLPVPRTQFGAAEWGGKLWIFGGADFGSKGAEKGFIFQDDVLAADLGAESPDFAATGHKLPRGRRAFGGACIGDRYYLIGGMSEDFGAVEVCDVFDFRTGRWETIPSPGGPRISPDCAALEGKLYLAGGSAPRPSASGRLSDGGTAPHTALECFDPAAGTWSRVLESLPFPSGHIRMLPLRDRLLFWSTFDSTNSVLRLAVVALGKGVRV